MNQIFEKWNSLSFFFLAISQRTQNLAVNLNLLLQYQHSPKEFIKNGKFRAFDEFYKLFYKNFKIIITRSFTFYLKITKILSCMHIDKFALSIIFFRKANILGCFLFVFYLLFLSYLFSSLWIFLGYLLVSSFRILIQSFEIVQGFSP